MSERKSLRLTADELNAKLVAMRAELQQATCPKAKAQLRLRIRPSRSLLGWIKTRRGYE